MAATVTRYNGIWRLTAVADSTEIVFIKRIRWVAVGATLGHRCILKDSAGNIVWESTAGVVNFVDSFVLEKTTKIVVDTLGSGVVYLYE